MSDFTFILGFGIVGSYFIPDGIQTLAGKEVKPKGFVFRKMNPEKGLLITVIGGDGRKDHLPPCCFSQHPTEEEIRATNNLRGII
ncbi:MAG: hypothetical protein U9O55_04540 [Patescibacteria group bacterium]|nr:hypothetical protein [Patescibacteria group bacterium]